MDENEKPVTCRACNRTYVPSFMCDFYRDEGKETGLCERCMMAEAFAPAKIAEDKLHSLCRFQQGAATCAFIVADGDGLKCAKGSIGLNNAILARWQARSMKADGNYCHGPKDYKLMTPEEVERHRNAPEKAA
jgi:hypothetical protein